MNAKLLPWNQSLGRASRLPVGRSDAAAPISASETVVLLLCGFVSAATVLTLEFKLKMPGHSILRAVFPMAFGLAAVPRRGAGTVMASGAILTALGFSVTGWGERGLGAMTSLFLIGPCLDLALRGSGTGRRVYGSFVAAGVVANLLAMLVQIAAKSAGWKVAGTGKSLAEWLPRAALSYPLCGALAGLISAIIWFRWNAGRQPVSSEEPR